MCITKHATSAHFIVFTELSHSLAMSFASRVIFNTQNWFIYGVVLPLCTCAFCKRDSFCHTVDVWKFDRKQMKQLDGVKMYRSSYFFHWIIFWFFFFEKLFHYLMVHINLIDWSLLHIIHRPLEKALYKVHNLLQHEACCVRLFASLQHMLSFQKVYKLCIEWKRRDIWIFQSHKVRLSTLTCRIL